MEYPNSIRKDYPILNIYLIGKKDAGCSNFYSQYINNIFPYIFHGCIRPDFGNKIVLIDDSYYKIRLWFSNYYFMRNFFIPKSILAKPLSFLILGDLTSDTFFNDVTDLLEKIQKLSKRENYICVVGSKNDLVDLRKVSSEEILEITQKFGVNYMECSSKSGFGINECVLIAARALIDILVKETNIQ
ncbi:hypothetical protein SteCoe_25581 [Stentor coeruleus]|uniref:Small GTPase n=1 Tax=Stentor coeruleus TaxID=5963 RepID=A0A1R2BEV2_9CILI|nr:hypothetical protein SteCoe_25581 [Stentor coeruleus]